MAFIRVPPFPMVIPKFTMQAFRKVPLWVFRQLIRQLRLGVRLAYQPTPPAWKAKQKGYCLSGWFDVASILLLLTLGLFLWW